MVDHKATTYRPRRAFIEPEIEPAEPKYPARPDRDSDMPIAPPVVDEEPPKPLYRDEPRTNGWSSRASRAAPPPQADPDTDPSLPVTPRPQRPRRVDEEATAILPRSRPGEHRSGAPLDAIDDYDDERKPLSRRTKLALLIGTVSVVVVIGLLVGYAVVTAASQSQRQPSGGGTSSNASQPPAQTETAVLTDASMLNPTQADILDRDRTWKVESTQPNPPEDAQTAACFGGTPAEGQPTPQQKIVRVLNGGGKNAPKALHEATTYLNVGDANQAYVVAAKTLGGCAVTGSYIQSGHAVSGVGDQAIGVVVMDGNKGRAAHSVVLNRGRPPHERGRRHPAVAGAGDKRRGQGTSGGQQGSVRPGRGRVRRYPLRQGRAATARRGSARVPGYRRPSSRRCQACPMDCDRNRAAERGVQRIPVREKRQLGDRLGKIEELEGLPDPGQWDEVLRPERDRADDQGREGSRTDRRQAQDPT